MNVLSRCRSPRAWAPAAILLAVVAPAPARALALLDDELSLAAPGAPRPILAVALAEAEPEAPSLDFDLLGEPPPVASAEDPAAKRRRQMLRAHQAIGLGLVALQLATTTVGQLNYSDKYAGGPVTARYEATHTVLAYTTLGVFAVNGAIALLAPTPKGKQPRGFGRVSLHKLGMLVATAGMAAQGGLGIYTDRREGYLNQERNATIHLAIGYATLAAVGVAVGALVL